MNINTKIYLILLPFFLFALTSCETKQIAESSKEELSSSFMSKYLAEKGWNLYVAGDLKGSFGGGRYTDPVPENQGYEFWSNGIIAKISENMNGWFSVIYIVNDETLQYVGTLGENGNYIKTSTKYHHLLGTSWMHVTNP